MHVCSVWGVGDGTCKKIAEALIQNINRMASAQDIVNMGAATGQHRQHARSEFTELEKQLMKWGTDHEEDGIATASRYLLDGTSGYAEQVGILRLTDDLSFVATSLDLILHLQIDNKWTEIPLEIKCPTPMFGNRFDGRMKVKHLLQLHVQMKALGAPFAYLCYWTQETGFLYKVEFDSELWDLMRAGILNWRHAVITNEMNAPKSSEDKELYKKLWERCEEVYRQVLGNGGYRTLTSCVARPGK